MIRIASALLAVLVGSGCTSGPQATKPADDTIFPHPYTIDDFDNGLRLVTVPTGLPDIVALYIVSHVGSRNEVEPGRSGFAHLFEHMMFRGTEKYPAEKWQAVMERAGAETNAYTTDDRTVYHAVFSKEDLETILELESDRFQNLKYTEDQFRTETRAVLGEYNKNFSSPSSKLDEVVRQTAFSTHTYSHTTMGFERDVENMPTMYDYGLQFFDRYYRPEYTTISIVGDVDPKTARTLVQKHWGGWKRGTYKATIPTEGPQGGPKTVNHLFHTQTLPIVQVAFRAPAYDDEKNDTAVLDVISFQAFSTNSALYRKLVVEEQKVEDLSAGYSDHVDPYLFEAIATVKNRADTDYVRDQILATVERLKAEPIPATALDDVKSHLRYRFAAGLDSTASIAGTLAHYIGLRRTPDTINKLYRLYSQVTPEDVQRVARTYFVENGRTIATLAFDPKAAAAGDR